MDTFNYNSHSLSFPASGASTSSCKTPKRGSKTCTAGDRFIPNRGAMDLDLAHYNLTCRSEEEAGSPARQLYKQALAEQLFEGRGSKVLAFKNKAPAPSETYQNHLRSLYSKASCSAANASSNQQVGSGAGQRKVGGHPDKVLDAPGLRDDFYSNLVDWSSENQVAVALGQGVYLWNATTGDIDKLLETPTGELVSCLSWVGDGTTLAVGTSTAQVQLWDIARAKKLRTLHGHAADITALAWNKFVLSTGSKDSQIINHDVRLAQSQLATLSGHTNVVCGLRWSDDGTQLASGGNDNVVHIWDQDGQEPALSLTQHQSAVKALAWCPFQPNLLATGGGIADRTIRFWNTRTGACLNSIDTGSQVCALQWSSEYREIVSSHGFTQNQLCVWKYPSMEKVTELHGHSMRPLYMCLSPDGQTLVSGAGDERLRFWKVWPEKPVAAKKPVVKAMRTAVTATSAASSRKPIVIR